MTSDEQANKEQAWRDAQAQIAEKERQRQAMFSYIGFVMDAKKQMLASGDWAASKKCPYCEGRWHFRIAPNNKHIHAACDGSCKRSIME